MTEHISPEGTYWLEKLSGELSPAAFPPDRQAVATDVAPETEAITIKLDGQLSSRFLKLSNQSDHRLHMILVTAVKALLHKYSGLKDLIVGIPIYRHDDDDEYVNTVLAIRTGLDDNTTFKDLLLATRQSIIEADEHSNYPMETLLFKLNLQASAHHFPLFDVAVLLDNIHRKEDLDELPLNIRFVFGHNGEELDLTLEYNRHVYSAEAANGMLGHFSLLSGLAFENLDLSLADLSLLEEGEHRRINHTFNDTAKDFGTTLTIPGMVEEQVGKSPQNKAVVFENTRTGERRTLTYDQLNKKANNIAWMMKEKGVGRDVIAGAMLEPSIDMVPNLLGVMKAGGAYLPIDPGLPTDRVAGMLRDCESPLLLTEQPSLKKNQYTKLQGLEQRRATPIVTPPAPQITDLDSLPFPDRSMMDLEKYCNYIGQVMVKNTISLQTARGCPYQCAYCSKIWGRNHVFRSADSTFEEMKLYYDMGVRRFAIFDDIFNLNKENGMRFLEKIVKNDMDVQLFFPNGLRGDLLTKDYIDLLVEAGLTATALALETASPRLQTLIKKNLKLDVFRENVEYFCKKHPQVILELFSIHGFPTETEDEARMTLDFIKSLQWVHFPYIFNLKIYPHTGMADLAMKNGIAEEDIYRSENMAFHEPSPTSPFDKGFTANYQAEFINDYFLNKERLLSVLPVQMSVMTEDEIVQKYDSYFPEDLKSFDALLDFLGLERNELPKQDFVKDDTFRVPDLNEKLKQQFPQQKPAPDAVKVLMLDLSQHYSSDTDLLYDVVEPPLGAVYVMTYLKRQLGDRVEGKVLKSRIDFDSHQELKECLESFKPDIIGVRSLTFYRDYFHSTVALIRQWGIDCPIVAGGPYATRNSQSLLQDPNIDLMVFSEGETVFTQLISKFLENGNTLPDDKELASIQGIAFVPRGQKQGHTISREVILHDQITEKVSSYPDNDPTEEVEDDGLAYIIYTSGSTGVPKGVMIEHRNAANTLRWYGDTYKVKEGTRVLTMTSYTFDPSVEQIFGTLAHGGTVYLTDRQLLTDKEAFREFLQKNEIEIINGVPSLLKEMLVDEERLPSLRAVISGGEKLDDAVKDGLLAMNYPLYNQYGPTETTIDAIAGTCDQHPVRLGTPIANTKCYIVDPNLNLQPAGVRGELMIAGHGVCRGYLNNPEATVEKFVSNPFAQDSNGDYGKLYRTGDLAMFSQSGILTFHGRIDHQVKVRGFRIELGEIESRLLNYRSIEHVVVMDRKDGGGGVILAAFYTAPEALDEYDLASYCAERLPEYMVPVSFVYLDHMPKTPGGKIDRRALAAMDITVTSQGGGDYQEPQSPVEKELANVWQEVLGRKEIGINENFFSIGGDSIKAIQIVSRMNKAGYKLKMSDLFRHPVISLLAPMVTAGPQKQDMGSISGPLPLLPSQVEFFKNITIDNHHYNHAVIIETEERLDRRTLETIFKKIQGHHDALRTVFRQKDGVMTAEILDEHMPLHIEEIDLTAEDDVDHAITKRANSIQASIHLNHGPLLKLGLFQLKKGSRLLIIVHHLVMDGVSWRILFEDIGELYSKLKQGEPLQLPPKSSSIKDWAQKLVEFSNEPSVQEESQYWNELLNADHAPLPANGQQPENTVQFQTVKRVTLDSQQTDSLLTTVHDAFGTEINDLLLAAFGLAVKEHWGLPGLLVALDGHGREDLFDDIEVQRTVGWFTSVFPVVVDAGEAKALDRHIIDTKERLHRIPRKGTGYGILKYLSSNGNSLLSDGAEPTVSFNYLGQFDMDTEDLPFRVIADSTTGHSHSPNQQREYQLDIECAVSGGKLNISASFSNKLFEAPDIESLLKEYKRQLERIIDFCLTRGEREMTPTDFSYKDLSMEDLEQIGALVGE